MTSDLSGLESDNSVTADSEKLVKSNLDELKRCFRASGGTGVTIQLDETGAIVPQSDESVQSGARTDIQLADETRVAKIEFRSPPGAGKMEIKSVKFYSSLPYDAVADSGPNALTSLQSGLIRTLRNISGVEVTFDIDIQTADQKSVMIERS